MAKRSLTSSPKKQVWSSGMSNLVGELAEGGGLVAGAFDDEGDVHLLGVAVDQRGGFAGDEGHA